jgi:CheY-like chemotaxis protein
VVEDDALVREYVVAQLKSLGYRVTSAANAIEALSALEKDTTIEILFTDVIMPGPMNGRQLADEAVRRMPSLNVVYTSGYTENAMFIRAGSMPAWCCCRNHIGSRIWQGSSGRRLPEL